MGTKPNPGSRGKPAKPGKACTLSKSLVGLGNLSLIITAIIDSPPMVRERAPTDAPDHSCNYTTSQPNSGSPLDPSLRKMVATEPPFLFQTHINQGEGYRQLTKDLKESCAYSSNSFAIHRPVLL